MSERFLEERPLIEQTLDTFRVAGEMFLAGKKLALKRLQRYPYVPTLRELAHHIVSHVPNLSRLTEWQRSFLAVNGVHQSYCLLTRRAEYQRRYLTDPEETKQNLLSSLSIATMGNIDLDPNKVTFEWSLFSIVLVAKKTEFEKAHSYFRGYGGGSLGFVSPFATELGFMPIILDDKGPSRRLTEWHEDIHLWQEAMGYEFPQFILDYEIHQPPIRRAFLNENIQPGDFIESQMFFEKVLGLARKQIRIELPAYLWCREFSDVGILNNPNSPELPIALLCLQNTIYGEKTGLSETQKIQKYFLAQVAIYEVDLERKRMEAITKVAMAEYKGLHDPFQWAAARATVLPPGFSIDLFKAVFLGRNKTLKEEPKINFNWCLAAALSNHAKLTVDPKISLHGGYVSSESVDRFIQAIVEIFNQRNLYQGILDQLNPGEIDLKLVRSYLIDIASKVVSKGLDERTKRELEEKL